MRSMRRIVVAAGLGFLALGPGLSGTAVPGGQVPTIRQLWERCQETLPPSSYKILKNEVVVSDTDPGKKLRRLEVRFTSQTIGQWERRMTHTGIIYTPSGTP
jgi:hypothetical protein